MSPSNRKPRARRGKSLPHVPAAALESDDARVRLVERIVTTLDRTFSAEGEERVRGLQDLAADLLRLDDASLRALALEMGLDEPGEPEPDEQGER